MTTVRDFGQVFDAYAQFEESMINAKMETTAEMGPSEEGEWSCVIRLYKVIIYFLKPACRLFSTL